MNRLPTHQQGAALLVALMFLIMLTLLSVNAMRSSTMELHMASNEQEQRLGFDSAQSATSAAIASDKLVVTNPGDVICFGFGTVPGCTDTVVSNVDLGTGAGIGGENSTRAVLDEIAPCPRSITSSIRGSSSLRTSGSGTTGNCAYFTVQSIYDATARRGGRIETQQGFVKLAY